MCDHIHYYSGGVYEKTLTKAEFVDENDRRFVIKMCDVCHGLVVEYYTPYDDEKDTTIDISINESWLDKALIHS